MCACETEPERPFLYILFLIRILLVGFAVEILETNLEQGARVAAVPPLGSQASLDLCVNGIVSPSSFLPPLLFETPSLFLFFCYERSDPHFGASLTAAHTCLFSPVLTSLLTLAGFRIDPDRECC